jgi:predicted Fe-Mo cluster-binding NifX family protein
MTKIEKIAIPSQPPGGLKSEVTPRFGRCQYFTIVVLQNKNIKEVNVLNNEGTNAMGGAGPMAAQLIANEGVNKVIGANYGPNAAGALMQGNIEMYGPFQGKVQDVVNAYLDNKIPKISSANVKSHSGMSRSGRGMGRNR